MIGREHDPVVRWGINVVVLILILGIGLYVWHIRNNLRLNTATTVLTAQHHADAKILGEQHRADHKLCVEIEKVKAALRAEENATYSHLYRDLRLLRIPPTAHILKLARDQHRFRLNQFKRKPCRLNR